jgi:hypothetical protein
MSDASATRLTLPQPIDLIHERHSETVLAALGRLRPGVVMMSGDNPALPPMPEKPKLLDFFRARFDDFTLRHLLQSASLAQRNGCDEKIVLACLLHDISVAGLIRTDHGYWAAQMIAPYVDPEVAWAVEKHQALRFFADPQNGYDYPQAYLRYFGPDHVVPDYLRRAYEEARAHRWYMTARVITINDIYTFEEGVTIDPAAFEDVVGRHFRQPQEGLGFDNSPVAHMWRTMIWPDNFL